MSSAPAPSRAPVGTTAAPTAVLGDMIHGSVIAQILATTARLGLADHLASGPQTSAALAAATGAHPDGLSRLLRAAATAGLVVEVEPNRFALTPVGACLRTDGPAGSLVHHAAIASAAPGQWRCLERLFDAVMTGHSVAIDALGMGLLAYYQNHPEEGAHFTAVAAGLATRVAAQVAARYDASEASRIVEVGDGVLLSALLTAAPRATGVLFDRPERIAAARASLTERGLASRVELIGGDDVTQIPTGGDLYLLHCVLHNADDDHAHQILAGCHRAGPAGSTLLVVEALLPTGPAPSALHRADLAHLVMFGGRERTREHYQILLYRAGYQLEHVIPIPVGTYPWHLLETRRP